MTQHNLVAPGFGATGTFYLALLALSISGCRRGLGRAVSLLVPVCVSLVVVEAILWTLNYEYSPLKIVKQKIKYDWRDYHAFNDKHFIYDPELIWRPKRNCSIFNSQGYRGKVLPDLKEPGSVRIFAIGDSNTLGWDTAVKGSNWPGYLEELLAKYKNNVTVTNAGVYGYSSFQGLRILKESLRFKPDLILLSFGCNDAHRVITSDSAYSNQLIRKLKLDKVLSLCRTGQLLVAFIDQLLWRRGTLVPRVTLEEYRRNMEEIIRLSNENGVKVVLLTRPFIGGSSDELRWINFAPSYNALTLETARENHVNAIDIYDYFKDKEVYFEDECHFNELGHRLAADIIFQNIKSLMP